MSVILGYFDPDGADFKLVARMAESVPTRGLGKLVLGAPPEIYHDAQSAQVAFSGVLYNGAALRRALEASGAEPFAESERAAALVAHGYLAWGVEVLERLHGAFALAIWDAQRQWLILARDRMGERGLYYASLGAEFLFATQARRLLAAERIARAVNTEALPYYLSVGYVPPPYTLFKGVRKLGAAEYMLVNEHSCRVDRFCARAWIRSAMGASLLRTPCSASAKPSMRRSSCARKALSQSGRCWAAASTQPPSPP